MYFQMFSDKNVIKGNEKGGESVALVDSRVDSADVAFNFPKEVIPSASEVSAGASGGVPNASGVDSKGQYLSEREQLINSNPAQSLMKKEITDSLSKELKILEKQKAKLERSVTRFAEGYAELVAKIRELYRMLESLATATYEQLKSMWLKLVHNIA